MPIDADTPVSTLRNIGPVSARWLEGIGITSLGDLERTGAVLAYRILKEHQPGANANLLYALHGALTDTHWAALSKATRERLKREVEKVMRMSPSGG